MAAGNIQQYCGGSVRVAVLLSFARYCGLNPMPDSSTDVNNPCGHWQSGDAIFQADKAIQNDDHL